MHESKLEIRTTETPIFLAIMSITMNKIIAKLQRFGRIRQLHTIISQETISPSSPTPPHLRTYNLTLLDQFAPDMHTPFVFFYRNYKNGDTNILKKSLSKCLTQYYPFAGRIPTPPELYINCNDEGVEFLEAFNDSSIDDYIHKNVQNETIDQLFPYGLSYTPRASCSKLLDIQLNHFSGGGVAIALSMSHKIADATTIANFINHWATITRQGSPIKPCFISSSRSNNIEGPKFGVNNLDYTMRRFVFPNSKLQELKNKVIAMGTTPTDPTRVEVVTALLFKHAVSAAATKLGSLKPSNLFTTVNIRKKLVEKYPESVAGNLFTLGLAKMEDSDQIRLDEVITKIRKAKMDLEGVKDQQEVFEKFAESFSTLQGDVYIVTSACKVPFYEVDFGWGKPIEVRIRFPNFDVNYIILMDTAAGDGIIAYVHMLKEEMVILEKDKKFLTYVIDV